MTDTPASATMLSTKERLSTGNEAYLRAESNRGDISPELRQKLVDEGQKPFACVVCCSDSRVVPEHIFTCGLGELFTIRVAGNVIGDMELASCVYAADHLHVDTIVVLGHTCCGAIASTMASGHGDAGAMTPLLGSIAQVIDGITDPTQASIANAIAGVATCKANETLARLESEGSLAIVPALYHTDTGVVEFLD